jgi:competence protein ComEA
MLAWVGLRRAAGLVALGVSMAVGAWFLLHAPAPPVERSLPLESRTAVGGSGPDPAAPLAAAVTLPAIDVSPTTSGDPPTVVVHVAGAVAEPGLVRLDADARVADAVANAGGPTAEANLDGLNLAATVVDGSRIYVPANGEPYEPPAQPPPTGSTGPGPLVDINRATAAELDSLPGVGPATAQAIVTHRQEHGPFQTVEDLLDVPGIGRAKLERFRDRVTV